MDPNNVNDFDETDTYDHYDAFFQLDYDRYMRDYESYQNYVGLCEQKAGGSSDGQNQRRTYIFPEREKAKQRLIDDYFGDEEHEPKYSKEKFRRRSRFDATTHSSIGPILKCTSVICQMAYDTTSYALDEYLHVAERTSRHCLDFTKCIHVLYHENYLRRPAATDIQDTYKLHGEKHELPGMLGFIDCMYWDWKNCPKSLQWQFKRTGHKYPTVMLEGVADQILWIWHAYFGGPGKNNDLNVLYGSPLFDVAIADIAPECRL